MRTSYILRTWNQKLTLLPEILAQLNIERKCVLHAVRELDDPEFPSAIVSPIPVDSWHRAHRIVFYTAAEPGSVARATRALSDMEINILSASAAAFSPRGETCLTVLAELPERLLHAKDRLRKMLEDRLTKENCLSHSRLFHRKREESLRRVRVVKMRVLSHLARLYAAQGSCFVDVEDWTINLRSVRDGEGRSTSLFRLQNDFESRPKSLMLLTPDTEERFVRLAPMKEGAYRVFSFASKLTSPVSKFSGYFEQAVKVLADHNVNVYAAKTVVTSKAQKSEEAKFTITADLNGSKLEYKKEGEISEQVRADTVTAFRERATSLNRRNTSRVDDFRMKYLFHEAPLVFVATNAKPKGIDRKYIKMAIRLVRMLKQLGLQPVNVDISTGRSLRQEVDGLLRLCPLMVSLYLPEGPNLLGTGRRGKSGADTKVYAPSDYTMYEEAFMCAKKRILMRLRHKQVFGPRYIGDQIEYSFDEDTFDAVLDRMKHRIGRVLSQSTFADLEEQCQEKKRLAPNDWTDRDLEQWLTGSASDEAALPSRSHGSGDLKTYQLPVGRRRSSRRRRRSTQPRA